MNADYHPEIWAVLPAAGSGRRMQSEIPKQYLSLLGRPVLQWSLDAVTRHRLVRGTVIALAEGDPWWPRTRLHSDKPVLTVGGGAERSESVFNALSLLRGQAGADSWVLVHDAVRPCLTEAEVEALLGRGMNSAGGGLLASPVRDTLKREDNAGCVARTAERSGLWHAMTPQLFPLRSLHAALARVIEQGLEVTDEAQAMEQFGQRPVLVEGRSTNLKITRPADLPLAKAILLALHPELETDHVPDRTGL